MNMESVSQYRKRFMSSDLNNSGDQNNTFDLTEENKKIKAENKRLTNLVKKLQDTIKAKETDWKKTYDEIKK